MNKIKLYIQILLGFSVMSCDSDLDNLGLELLNNNEANGVITPYDLKVYNIDNGDVTRADSYVLKKATLGAFSEDRFGGQKSSYITQVRLSNYSPKFGENLVVDSVVLEISPEYYINQDSMNISTRNLEYNGDIDAKQTIKSYKVIKYGKTRKPFTIQVNEVIEDLGDVGNEILSNKKIKEGEVLGIKSFGGVVSSVDITKKDGSSLLSNKIGFRIPLSKDYFQRKIVEKVSLPELENEKNFVNYFKGIKISVQENDGYLISFVPDEVTMKMYYTSGNVNDRKSSVYNFNLGSSNVHLNQIDYDRNAEYKKGLAETSSIYLQGMGGAGAGVKLDNEMIGQLRKLYREEGTAILSAKIRLYVDEKKWKNSYTRPESFMVKVKGSKDFITDLKVMSSNVNYEMVKAYPNKTEPLYYDIDITKTIKDIVEKGEKINDLEINVGEYQRLADNRSLLKEDYNTNVYSPNRVILVGTDVSNPNSAKLMITHITK